MTFPLRSFLVAGLLLTLDVTGQHACASAAETRIVQLKHRAADEVVPILQPLLEPGGRISGQQYQLFVRTSDRNFAEIERILKEIDTPLRNLRIAVRHADSNQVNTREQSLSADQNLGNNTRIILSPANPSQGGLVVRRAGTAGTMQYHTERRTVVRSRDGSQFVTVVEGQRAYIAVGVELPQVQSYLVFAGRHLTVASGITYRTVSTGFEVLPRVQGSDVDLEITPRVAFLSDQGSQQVSFSEMSTHVRVKIGEWVDLGGALSNASQVGRMILGDRSSESQEQSSLQVRVDN